MPQLKLRLKAFRADGAQLHGARVLVSGKKAELVDRLKALMAANPAAAPAAPAAPAVPAVVTVAGPPDEGSDWEDNTPDVEDDLLDEMIAGDAVDLDDPQGGDDDEDFAIVMSDNLLQGGHDSDESDSDGAEEDD